MTEKNLQISGNIGNAYFIFKADDVSELDAHIDELAQRYDAIADNLQKIQQIQLVKEAFAEKQGFGGKPAAATPAAGGAQKARTFNGPKEAAAEAPDGSYTCDHGAMKKLDYKKGDGTRVHGWYCQSKDKDWKKKCKTISLPGHGDAA